MEMPKAALFGRAAFSANSVLETLTYILSHSRVVLEDLSQLNEQQSLHKFTHERRFVI